MVKTKIDPEKVNTVEKRYVLLELACSERRCEPCTYPNCQRYAREHPKGEPLTKWLCEVKEEDWQSLAQNIKKM